MKKDLSEILKKDNIKERRKDLIWKKKLYFDIIEVYTVGIVTLILKVKMLLMFSLFQRYSVFELNCNYCLACKLYLW